MASWSSSSNPVLFSSVKSGGQAQQGVDIRNDCGTESLSLLHSIYGVTLFASPGLGARLPGNRPLMFLALMEPSASQRLVIPIKK